MTGSYPDDDAPRALVVYESMFDHTAAMARAVVRGLRHAGYRAEAVPVTSLAADVPLRLDLLVTGAPTHLLGLSRRLTRCEAVHRGAPADRAPTGLRDWIGRTRPERYGTVRVAVFDTCSGRAPRRRLHAARTASRLLRRRGFRTVDRSSFTVHDDGIDAGELARAEQWGACLGAR